MRRAGRRRGQWRGRSRGRWRREAGSAVIELLIIFPVVVLFAELTVLGGRVATARSDVASAAREAARQATLANSRASAASVIGPVALTALADRGYACESPSVRLGPNTRFERGGQVEVVVDCRLNFSDLDLLTVAPGGTTVQQVVLEPIDRYRAVR